MLRLACAVVVKIGPHTRPTSATYALLGKTGRGFFAGFFVKAEFLFYDFSDEMIFLEYFVIVIELR